MPGDSLQKSMTSPALGTKLSRQAGPASRSSAPPQEVSGGRGGQAGKGIRRRVVRALVHRPFFKLPSLLSRVNAGTLSLGLGPTEPQEQQVTGRSMNSCIDLRRVRP